MWVFWVTTRRRKVQSSLGRLVRRGWMRKGVPLPVMGHPLLASSVIAAAAAWPEGQSWLASPIAHPIGTTDRLSSRHYMYPLGQSRSKIHPGTEFKVRINCKRRFTVVCRQIDTYKSDTLPGGLYLRIPRRFNILLAVCSGSSSLISTACWIV